MAAGTLAVHGRRLARSEELHFLKVDGALSRQAECLLLIAVDLAIGAGMPAVPVLAAMSETPELQPCTSPTSLAQALLAPTPGLACLPPLLQVHAHVQTQLV